MADPTAQNETLQRLLAACAQRDSAAFGRLYEATSAKLFGVAIRILRREDWAEEVLQDSYVNIWSHASKYSSALSAPMTWMTSIVRNRCLDWLRRPNLELVVEDGEDGGNPIDAHASEVPGPLDELSRSTEARTLANCLSRLEAKQRQAVMLAFYDGLSHSELAAHLREPLGTVKTWVRRGLMQLKGCLESTA
jgi:RNA polymerase sigma-70 factor (ECF subfamily)